MRGSTSGMPSIGPTRAASAASRRLGLERREGQAGAAFDLGGLVAQLAAEEARLAFGQRHVPAVVGEALPHRPRA
jgi:hypothetical protein